MKKSLILGTAVVALVAAMAPAFSASAASENATIGNSTKNVAVGEVDDTVYSVEIDWDDLVFDWEYNLSNNDFAFLGNEKCRYVGIKDNYPYLLYRGKLFSDHACSQVVDEGSFSEEGSDYYGLMPGPFEIKLYDDSVNGKVKATASFAAEEKYSWVKGVFTNIVMSGTEYNYQTNKFERYEEDDGVLKGHMGIAPYVGNSQNHTMRDTMFHLEIIENAEIDTDSIEGGDKIGTLTLAIEPDLN